MSATDDIDNAVAGVASLTMAHTTGSALLGPVALLGLAKVMITAAELGFDAEREARAYYERPLAA